MRQATSTVLRICLPFAPLANAMPFEYNFNCHCKIQLPQSLKLTYRLASQDGKKTRTLINPVVHHSWMTMKQNAVISRRHLAFLIYESGQASLPCANTDVDTICCWILLQNCFLLCLSSQLWSQLLKHHSRILLSWVDQCSSQDQKRLQFNSFADRGMVFGYSLLRLMIFTTLS